MRVLLDAHQIGRGQTGNETYVTELSRALGASTKVDLVLAMESGTAPPLSDRTPAVRRVPRNGLLRLLVLARLAEQTRSDVLHTIYFLPPYVGRPSVVTVHDISYELHPEYFRPSEVWRNRVLVRDAIRRATYVVTVSERSRQDIIDRYSADPQRVVSIPNGVSELFKIGAEAPQMWDGSRPLRVLGVGTIQPRKNLVRLAEAVEIVASCYPVQLRLVGPDGYQSQSILERVRHLSDVVVLGYLSEERLAAEYRAADVFVYPSLYEGFGLPVLEAMASGVPVVTSDRGSLPEVAGDAALIVDPTDAAGIADAVIRLAEDRHLRHVMRDRGRVRAADFSWERVASSTAAVYEAAAGRRSAKTT